jgi:hypothetical protein
MAGVLHRQRQRGDEKHLAVQAGKALAGRAKGIAPGNETLAIGARRRQIAQTNILLDRCRSVARTLDEDLWRAGRLDRHVDHRRFRGADIGQIRQAQQRHLGQAGEMTDADPAGRVQRACRSRQ